MTTVIYPGTFDPITNGHLDIIERSAKLFPKLLVAVANSPSKKPMFELAERIDLVRKSTAHLANVQVLGFSDLLANVVQQHHIQAIIRGVRSTTDFEYERQLASLNYVLAKGVDSVFFPTSEQVAYISSTMVREIYLHGGDISPFVPQPVVQALAQRKV